MNRLLKRGWVSVILWAIILAAAVATLPDISGLVRDKGANTAS